MKCPSCDGTGLHAGPFVAAVRPNCRTCDGRGTVAADFEFHDEPPCGDDCDDCEDREDRECGLEPVKVVRGLDYEGMARDLAGSLAEANCNIDRLVAALIDAAEELHKAHNPFGTILEAAPRLARFLADPKLPFRRNGEPLPARAGDTWQDCNDPRCRKIADVLGSLIGCNRARGEND